MVMGVISIAAGKVFFESGKDAGSPFAEKQCLLGADSLVAPFIPLSKLTLEDATRDEDKRGLTLHAGEVAYIVGLNSSQHLNGRECVCHKLDKETGRWHVQLESGEVKAVMPKNLETRAEQTKAIKSNLNTIVLATVYAAAWRKNWMVSFVMLIIEHYCSCQLLCLFAIKGGPATDCEVRFIEEVMLLLGFDLLGKAQQSGETYYRWKISRQGIGEDFKVVLRQFRTVEAATLATLKMNLELVGTEYLTAPNLKRAAVVSCPLNGPNEEPIHDVLNQRLNETIAHIAEEASEDPHLG